MSKTTEPEKSYRDQLAKEFRACRKVSRAWAIWYQKYNTALMWYVAGRLHRKTLENILEKDRINESVIMISLAHVIIRTDGDLR